MLIQKDGVLTWQGYSDATPSESIQAHEIPAISVCTLFPYHPSVRILDIPVPQYKHVPQRRKADRARRLSDWLLRSKEYGLEITGMLHAHSQVGAANVGLELLQELMDAHCVPHYGKFRLHYGNNWIDFPQAVALVYYWLTLNFGVLRASQRLPADHRNLIVAMDRFPGPSLAGYQPGQALPPSQGRLFIEYLRENTTTGEGIEQENREKSVKCEFDTLDWWKPRANAAWQPGKSHPHFTLSDWAAVAAIAKAFPEQFESSFNNRSKGKEVLDAVLELYQTFKSFNLWSFDESVLSHIRCSTKAWDIPEEAREFILARAGS